MKRWPSLIILALSIQGCQTGLPIQKPEADKKHATYYSMDIGSDPKQWLQKRNILCLLPIIEQRERFNVLSKKKHISSRSEQIERLLLATCFPDMTPGLLREALNDLLADDSWSDEEFYLLHLIRDFDRSNRQFEVKNQQLKNELESTIKGIRDIESDLDNLEHEEGTP